MKKTVNIAFFGSPSLAAACLKDLIKTYSVKAVFTKPDKQVGRGRKIKSTKVNDIAVSEKIPVYKPQKLNAAVIESLVEFKTDLIVVVAYGKILPENILSQPRFGALNLHASLLPKYRGPSPIQAALLNGDRLTGMSVQLMNSVIDTGDIVSQEKIFIHPEWTAEDLLNEFIERAPPFLVDSINSYISGQVTPKKQPENGVSYCSIITKEDGLIDWSRSSEIIKNRVNAFNIWPVSYTYLEGKVLRIYNVRVLQDGGNAGSQPGKIIDLDKREGIIVETGQGMVSIQVLQLENKKRMTFNEFLNGYRNLQGKLLGLNKT